MGRFYFNLCADTQSNRTFIVLTSFTAAGSWDTDNGEFPDDEYEVGVKAKDVSNNDATDSIKVCVEN